ncbi:hypothetical protein [Kribbella deserti]|uniref:Uncharacterized protein n=1 Tax=Kribbella deserti TaxID=1926257 RepID=A0ABV6QN23_9ACTN
MEELPADVQAEHLHLPCSVGLGRYGPQSWITDAVIDDLPQADHVSAFASV